MLLLYCEELRAELSQLEWFRSLTKIWTHMRGVSSGTRLLGRAGEIKSVEGGGGLTQTQKAAEDG